MQIITQTPRPEIVLRAPSINFKSLVWEWYSTLDNKETTKKYYKRTINLFFEWANNRGLYLPELQREDILRFKNDLLAEGKSSLSVASYLNSVKQFFEWCESKRYFSNIAKGIKLPKRKQQFRKQPLTISQAKDLIETTNKGRSLRDYAIVNLLVRSGLRTIEVIRANYGDITFMGGERVLLVQGKGRDEKDNFIKLTPKTYAPIEEYLKTRKNLTESSPLFVSNSRNSMGQRLSTRTISKTAKESLIAIGLNERSFTAHSLRHTTAVNILRAGGSLELAQMTLRHSNPATTQIYTATLNEERRLKHSGEDLIETLY